MAFNLTDGPPERTIPFNLNHMEQTAHKHKAQHEASPARKDRRVEQTIYQQIQYGTIDELLPLPPERTIQPCVYGVEQRHIDNARANMHALQFRGTLNFSTQASNALNEMLQAGINIKTHEDTSRGKRQLGNVIKKKRPV